MTPQDHVEWWDDPITQDRVVAINNHQHRITQHEAIDRGYQEHPISALILSQPDAYALGIESWLRELFAPDNPPAWLSNP